MKVTISDWRCALSDVVRVLDIAPELQPPEWWRGYGFTGRLSEMDYYLWFRNAASYYNDPNFVTSPSREFTLRVRMGEEFQLIRDSEFIMENFFKLPNILRQFVEQFAAVEAPVSQIEKFVRLALLLPAFDESVFVQDKPIYPLKEVASHLLDQVRLASTDSVAYAFESSIEEYVAGSIDGVIQRHVLLMLALVYGTPLVLDVLQRWTLAAFPGSHDDFVAIVENWDPAWSQYPMDWIANLARGGNIE